MRQGRLVLSALVATGVARAYLRARASESDTEDAEQQPWLRRLAIIQVVTIVLAVLLGFSERIANAPKNGFGRSMAFAILLTTIAGIGASVLPLAPMPLAALAMVGVLSHISGSVAFFGCRMLGAFVAFLSFVMVSLLSVALLEMLGVLMSAREMM